MKKDFIVNNTLNILYLKRNYCRKIPLKNYSKRKILKDNFGSFDDVTKRLVTSAQISAHHLDFLKLIHSQGKIYCYSTRSADHELTKMKPDSVHFNSLLLTLWLKTELNIAYDKYS